jgi:stage IV sporulation protein FB
MIEIPGKIPIRIHPYFWVIIFLLGFSSFQEIVPSLLFVGIACVSVLVHEFGHALTAYAFGQRVNVELVALGGMTHHNGVKLKLWQEFLVVLNGPLAGLLLAFLTYEIKNAVNFPRTSIPYFILSVFLNVNIFWTIINLIPVLPMDGGQLFRIIFEKIFGLKGVKFSFFVSMILAGVLAALCFYLQEIFPAAILLIFVFENYRNWKNSLDISQHDDDIDMQQLFKDGELAKHFGNYDEAIDKYSHVRDSTKQGILYLNATLRMAEAYFFKENYKKTYDLLVPLEKKLPPSGLKLLQEAALKTGNLKKAIDVGIKLFHLEPNYSTAVNNAMAHALDGEVHPAVGWLQGAIREGLPNVNQLLSRPEFDKIRQDPQFKSLNKAS